MEKGKWLPVKMVGTKVVVKMLDGEVLHGILRVCRDDCYAIEVEDGKLLHVNPAGMGYIRQE